MKLLYPATPLYLRQPLSILFSFSFSTVPSPSPSQPPFIFLLNQIKPNPNPNHHPSLTTLLAHPHSLNPASSLILIDYLSQLNKLTTAKTLISHLYASPTLNLKLKLPFLYTLLFNFLLKHTNNINHIETLWQDISGSVKTFTFKDYVILVCKFGAFDEIKDVYDIMLMGCCLVERQCYVALSAALCNLNEGFLAKKVVDEMCVKGMVVDDWTYYLLFKCFCRNGVIDEADLVLRKLVRNGFVVDVCVYDCFLHGLCKSGKYREADKLFRKLVKRVSGKTFGGRKTVLKEGRRVIFQLDCEGVVPEVMAYECYVRALCNAGKLDEAEVLLKRMMSGRALPEICVYGSFIKALFRGGRDDDAMKFFKVQRKKGLVRVDEIGRYVIMGLCEKGRTDDALKLFEDILAVNGFVNGSTVSNIILDSYWKHGGVAKAELFFERWRLDEDVYGKLDVMTFTIMFNGYCSSHDVSKAVMVFEGMLKRKMAVNGALYERLIRLLCDCGLANEALQYLNDMIENGHLIFCKRWRTLFQSVLSIEGHHAVIAK